MYGRGGKSEWFVTERDKWNRKWANRPRHSIQSATSGTPLMKKKSSMENEMKKKNLLNILGGGEPTCLSFHFSLILSHSLTLSLTHALFRSHSICLFRSHSVTQSLSLSLSLFHSHSFLLFTAYTFHLSTKKKIKIAKQFSSNSYDIFNLKSPLICPSVGCI